MSVLKDIADSKHKLEMTPMIDVTFLLLIFFMCMIKFKTLEGKLAAYLPKDVGVNPPDAEPIEKIDLVLKVARPGSKLHPLKEEPWSGTGPYRYGPDRVIQYAIGPRQVSSLEDVSRQLGDYFKADPERGMTIDPRQDIVNADVMAALDVAILAGFTDITFKGAPIKKATSSGAPQ